MPTVWNDATATDHMKSTLLWDIRNRQSPGIQRMVSALRSPQGGLPVSKTVFILCSKSFIQCCAFCEDTTYIKCFSSNDPSVQVLFPTSLPIPSHSATYSSYFRVPTTPDLKAMGTVFKSGTSQILAVTSGL